MDKRPRRDRSVSGPPLLVGTVLGTLLLMVSAARPAAARPLACTEISGIITTQLDLAGEVCVTADVLFRQGGSLTLAPGTQVSMCAGCSIQVSGSGSEGILIAEGTAAEPIVFAPATPGVPWERIHLVHPVSPQTLLRHVVIEGGGGSDPTWNDGALHVDDGFFGSATAIPVIDHVTITGSGAYGLVVDLADDDQTPPSISNVTITGSARAPIRVLASATGGLLENLQLTGNAIDTIHVGDFHAWGSGIALSRADMTWRDHGVPWELTGPVVLRDNGQLDEPTTLRIEAGNTILLHPDMGIQIGTLGTAFTRLLIEGTAAEPVVFDRLDAGSAPWRSIHFGQEGGQHVESRISHASFLHGGGLPSATVTHAVIVHEAHGPLVLEHVEVMHSANAAVYSQNGIVTSTYGRFESNQAGIRAYDFTILSSNVFSGNTEGAVVNLRPNVVCLHAYGNYWGDPSGPSDPSGAADACTGGQSNAGLGDGVSDGVRYRPLLPTDIADLPDASSISPDPYWLIADGVDTALVTVTLLGPDGVPVVGKQIEVFSDLGTVVQPPAPTDVNGRATAAISSSEEGFSILTARNVTDGVDLASIGGMVFWAGDPVYGGLISPGGVPYASPQLVIEGEPFRAGFPITMRLPMQNGTAENLDVEVVWSVSDFGIGGGWGDVATVSETLSPAEAWDALGVYYPPDADHRCIRATFTVTPQGSAKATAVRQATTGAKSKNVNTTNEPCKNFDLDNLTPGGAGLKGVHDHTKNATQEAQKARKCIGTQAQFKQHGIAAARAAGDYQEIVQPPVYSPPPLLAGGDVDQPEADAVNAVAAAAARMAALDVALAETNLRLQGAAQAQDDAASRRQLDAYQAFQREYADELDALAVALADLLAVTEGEGEPDTLSTPADFVAYIEDLDTVGYDADTTAFLEAFGLTTTEIEATRQAELAALRALPGTSTTFYGYLRTMRDSALTLAASLRATYGSSTARQLGPPKLGLEPMTASFEVGNPDVVAQTVELVVRPVELPVGWTYALDGPSPLLDPGESTTMTLHLDPGGRVLVEDARVRIAVEGYIEGELVGGVLIEKSYPALPLLIFADGFDGGHADSWSAITF